MVQALAGLIQNFHLYFDSVQFLITNKFKRVSHAACKNSYS